MFTVEENPYRNIEYSSARNKFVVFAGVHRAVIATCDTLDEAQIARDLHFKGSKRATLETATFLPYLETRATHA